MTLRDLMGNGAPEIEVSGLAYSSQSVTPGALFFCVPGFRADGHDFAPDAVARGAAALVCERPLGLGVPELVVDDVRAAMGPAAARFYGDPTAQLQLVGITGTNGKTTTAFLVRHLFEAAGRRCGLLGTVKRVVARGRGGGRAHDPRGDRPAAHLPAHGRRAATWPARWRSPRTRSSSAASAGITFACRVFTNLTQDHLDFHETMEDYFLAKRRLFDDGGLAVVEHRRRVRPPARRRGRLRDLLDRARGRLPRPRHRVRPDGLALHLRDARRGAPDRVARCRASSTSRTCSARWRRCARSASRRSRSRASAGCRGASSRSTRGRTSECSSTTPTRPTRSRTCCARRVRSRAGACTRCSARAATATAASGR